MTDATAKQKPSQPRPGTPHNPITEQMIEEIIAGASRSVAQDVHRAADQASRQTGLISFRPSTRCGG
jgi:hypothetical protein